jgi:uncharacterized protein YbbK (DUF523 family)
MASQRNEKKTYEYLVSGCLAGMACAHDGADNLKKKVRNLVLRGRALPICPELLGGLGVPREKAEMREGDGKDVLDGICRVVTSSGKDVTENYIAGAKKALAMARRYKIRQAVLKSRSPSCGHGWIYSGLFNGTLKKGDGVLASLFRRNRIKIFTEKDALHG